MLTAVDIFCAADQARNRQTRDRQARGAAPRAAQGRHIMHARFDRTAAGPRARRRLGGQIGIDLTRPPSSFAVAGSGLPLIAATLSAVGAASVRGLRRDGRETLMPKR